MININVKLIYLEKYKQFVFLVIDLVIEMLEIMYFFSLKVLCNLR